MGTELTTEQFWECIEDRDWKRLEEDRAAILKRAERAENILAGKLDRRVMQRELYELTRRAVLAEEKVRRMELTEAALPYGELEARFAIMKQRIDAFRTEKEL